MEMKGSYKELVIGRETTQLVCDMEMKGSYKCRKDEMGNPVLVCDMEMKGSYKNFLSFFLIFS